MSTHRNDFLVSSHQAKLHREAAEARLARAARERKDAAPAHPVTDVAPSFVERLTLGLNLALRRARPDIKVPSVTTPSVSRTSQS